VISALASTLIYIHGFHSSPQSKKATETIAYLHDNRPDINLLVPELPDYPMHAVTMLEQIISRCEGRVGLIGSSLGGFFATYLAEKFDIKAVLVNPSVEPHISISEYMGKNINPYTQHVYYLTHDHIEHFSRLQVNTFKHPENLWLMVQRGDEVLDYRKAVAKYDQSTQLIEPGGDHGFKHFDAKLPEIIRFLGL